MSINSRNKSVNRYGKSRHEAYQWLEIGPGSNDTVIIIKFHWKLIIELITTGREQSNGKI